MRSRIAMMYALLVAMNLSAWAWAWASFHRFPTLLATAFLAYMFGLRHAVDADHIAAIDNVTRKLMQQGQRPVGVGFFFSVGHSTVVFALTVAIAAASLAVQGRFAAWAQYGGLLGTGISAAFLLAIGIANFFVLISVYRVFQNVRRGGSWEEEDLDLWLARPGPSGRIVRSLFRLIGRSWQMYLVGFLFGLGFDTATEIGLLGISAREAARGIPVWSILVFPALFTSAMALADTSDGILMLGAYGWAFMKPLRKLYYNLTITFISVVVAVVVGGVEVLGLIRDEFNPRGRFWSGIGFLNDHFGLLGAVVVILFAVGWLLSVLIYRWNRFGE